MRANNAVESYNGALRNFFYRFLELFLDAANAQKRSKNAQDLRRNNVIAEATKLLISDAYTIMQFLKHVSCKKMLNATILEEDLFSVTIVREIGQLTPRQ